MTNDPKIAAMQAATAWAVDRYNHEDLMFEMADRWLAWYRAADRMPGPEEPIVGGDKQPCGAYVEPDWFKALPTGAREAYPWLVCTGEHQASNGWHTGYAIFGTHHAVSAWNAAGYDDPPQRCSCGRPFRHPGMPMDP